MEINGETGDSRKNAGTSRQLIATLIVNLSTLMFGVIFGTAIHMNLWDIRENPKETPSITFSGKMELMRLTFLGAISAVFICYSVCERFGRRLTLLLIGIPIGLCCFLIRFADNYQPFALSCLFGGIGSSMCLFMVPIYVAEISCDNMRGKLSSIRMVFITSGITIGYGLSDIMAYRHVVNLTLCLLAIYLLAMMVVPETPSYLLRKSQIANATRSLMWLRNNELSSVESELMRLTEIFQPTTTNADMPFRQFINFFNDHGTLVGWNIVSFLLIIQSFFAVNIVFFGQNLIFKLLKASTGHSGSTLMVGLIQVLAAIYSAVLIDRIGRRPLLFLSCMAMAIYPFYCIESSFSHVDSDTYMWAVVSAFIVSSAAYYFGMGPVPFVIAVEVFRENVLIHFYTFGTIISWISMYIFCELSAVGAFGIGTYCYVISNIILCVCTFSFTYYVVPETKGSTRETIVEKLSTNQVLSSLTCFSRT